MEITESKPERVKPNLDSNKNAFISIIFGLGLSILFTFLILWLVRILFRGEVPHINLSTILHQWYYWIFFLFVLSMLLIYIYAGIRVFIINGVILLIRRYNWINRAARVHATIVDKRMRRDYEFCEDYSYEVSFPELKLKYTPTKAIANPSEQTIWARVDISIFEKYECRDSVYIYYSVIEPSEFLIAGE